MTEKVECIYCNGTGVKDGGLCLDCDGSGEKKKDVKEK